MAQGRKDLLEETLRCLTFIRLELSPILGQIHKKQDGSIEAWSISEETHKPCD